MRSQGIGALVLVATVVAGCALAPGTEPAIDDDTRGGKTDDDSSALATIVFSEDFAIDLSGTITAGAPLRIRYAPDRLPGCRGDFNGGPGWTITASWYVDDGAPGVLPLTAADDGMLEGTLDMVPAGGEIVLYFQVTNRWGCQEFDSAYGANYHFPIEASAPAETTTISFEEDGSVSASGPVVAGATVVVHYEPSRVEECRGSMYGNPAWTVLGYASVDGGEAQSFEVTRVEGYERVPQDASLVVPRGELLEIWFQFTNRWGCVAWDSNGGENYEFPIESP